MMTIIHAQRLAQRLNIILLYTKIFWRAEWSELSKWKLNVIDFSSSSLQIAGMWVTRKSLKSSSRIYIRHTARIQHHRTQVRGAAAAEQNKSQSREYLIFWLFIFLIIISFHSIPVCAHDIHDGWGMWMDEWRRIHVRGWMASFVGISTKRGY